MKHIAALKYILLVVVFALSPSTSLFAQSSGSQISGAVKDPVGAVVPGAQVEVKNLDTNAVRSAQTDSGGAYSFPSLPIGPYTLSVKKDGFAGYTQTGIVLEVGSSPEINVTMKVGVITEQVEVQANASMVETQSTAVLQVIDPQQVVDLPLNGRQATDLIALSGAAINAAAQNGANGAINSLDYPTAVSYSVAGSQPNATNYYLDGAQHMDYRTDVGLPMPFPDALAEFSVGISSMPANLGVHPGGSVNGVTKSGGNVFHGNVFDFVRNGVLDATQRTFPTRSGAYASGARDTLVRNQYGGTIGGPILKNKVFAFFGFQGTNQNSTVGSATTTVPTAAMQAGNFTAALATGSGCTGAGTFLKSAFTTAPNSNIINPALLQTTSAVVASKVYALVPTANTIDACGDLTYTAAPSFVQENQFVTRIDWQRTQNDAIFGRYFVTNYTNPSYYTTGNLLSSSGVGLADRIQTVALGDTHIFGAHLINTVHLAFDRTATVRASNPGIPTLCQLGMNATCPVANQLSAYIKSTPGNLGYDFENSFGVSEGVAYSNGKHQLNMGATWILIQMNNDGIFQLNPSPTFSTATTGNALADFVTGNVDGYTQGNGQLGRDVQYQPSFYVQDAWKVTHNVQVTAGLRWDPFLAQHNKYKEVSDFTLAGYQAGTISKQYINAPPGVTFPGDPGFNGLSDTNSNYKTFAPRVGLVWDINGKGTQTLRAGYGFFFDTSILWNTMHVVLNPPWGETLSFVPASVAAGGGLANPFFGQAGGNPFPTPLNPSSTFAFPTNGTYVFENQTNKPTNVQQWNLAYQIQASKNLLLSATYIGNKTSHIWLGVSQNPSTFLPQYGGPTAALGGLPCTLPYGGQMYTFPVCNSPSQIAETVTVGGAPATDLHARQALNIINPAYGPLVAGGLISERSDFNGAYNGLLVSAQQRLAHGFSVLSNLTWSHCMDDGEIGQDITNSFENPAKPKANWGNCGYNRKIIANLSLQAQSPRFAGRATRALATGWNGSGIFTAQTGVNYNVVTGYDVSLTGVGLDRPNIVGNPNQGGTVANNPNCVAPASVHTIAYWFNPCAFTAASYGTYGNEHRNDQVGPANFNLNLALWRTFTLPERVHLDVRAEAFNALNHTQITNPSATLYSGNITAPTANAGLITSSATPRIMQLAIKASF